MTGIALHQPCHAIKKGKSNISDARGDNAPVNYLVLKTRACGVRDDDEIDFLESFVIDSRRERAKENQRAVI